MRQDDATCTHAGALCAPLPFPWPQPHRKANRGPAARAKKRQEAVLAHGGKRDDHDGPRKEPSCVKQELCLIDTLADAAHGRADELGGNTRLPAHAHDDLARRHEERQDARPREREPASKAAHAAHAQELGEPAVHVVEPLDEREVDARQRHEEDGRQAHVLGSQPDEQEHHHAGHRRRLDGHERRPKRHAHRPRRGRRPREQSRYGVGKCTAAHDAREREAHLGPEARSAHEPREGREHLERARQDERLRKGHAAHLPRHKPEGDRRHTDGRRPPPRQGCLASARQA